MHVHALVWTCVHAPLKISKHMETLDALTLHIDIRHRACVFVSMNHCFLGARHPFPALDVASSHDLKPRWGNT